MNPLKKYFFLSPFLFLITAVSVKAQPLLDTIYVNESSAIALSLPSLPDGWYTNPEQAPYDLRTMGGGKGMLIGAKTKNTVNAHLYISLGKRKLHFLVKYKKNINYNNNSETEYVYDNLKAIDEKSKAAELAETQPQVISAENTIETKPDKKKPAEENADYAYYALLSSGDRKMKLLQYAEAKADFEKAHKMRPGDLIATQRLSEVNAKLVDREKQGRKLQDAYKAYIQEGEKSLRLNKLEEARVSFEQALQIVPDDKTAKKNLTIIEGKEKLVKQNEELENNYNAAIAAGDKAFQKEDYETARAAYSKAIELIKNRPGPKEQLAQIDKIIAAKATKETEAKNAKAEKAAADKRQKETQELDKKYFAALKSADKLFINGDLTKARTAYINALQISDKPWPKERIAEIDKLIAEQDLREKTAKEKEKIRLEVERKEKEQQALENKYNTALEIADTYFKAGNYTAAKPAYRSAIAIIKKPWPEEQLKTIDRLVAEKAAAEKAEKLRIAKEKILTENYNKTIQNADTDLGRNNYTRAKKLYTDALALKPAESYPKEKLNEIQATLDRIAAEEKERKERITAAAELKRKYELAVSKGKSYLLQEDFVNAKSAYNEAASLKPTETEPQNQLKIINAKLVEIEIDERYQAQKSIADSLLISKKYDQSIQAYQDAQRIKATETYPASQIKYIQAEVKSELRRKEENEKYEAQRKEIEKETKLRDLINQGDKSLNAKNYQAAKQQYSEALKLNPDHAYAKQGYKIASYQLELANKVFTDKPVSKNNDLAVNETTTAGNTAVAENAIPQKQTNSSYEFQVKPLPYTDEELKAKYPSIDFKSLPPEQPFNEEAVDSKENTGIFKQVLEDKPRLDIDDKSHKIKMICQGMNFEDQSVYVKLLIQNNSKDDFLTGSMMLTWLRRSGSEIKLYPLYLFPSYLPVIKPGNEAVVIYVCRSYNIGSDEKLKFELNDRMNKIKLGFVIKGSVYNSESIR